MGVVYPADWTTLLGRLLSFPAQLDSPTPRQIRDRQVARLGRDADT